MTRHRKKRRLRLRSLYLWHRYLGLAAAALVLVLALTGLALNHTERLGLERRFVQWQSLLDWYGIKAPPVARAFPAGGHWVAQLGERVYLDGRPLPGRHGRLAGALRLSHMIVVALDDAILLLTPRGDLVERLGPAQGIPAGLRALGLAGNGRVALEAADGVYLTDADFLDWRKSPATNVRWVAPAEAPRALVERLKSRYLEEVLPLERVILDLHSGRILGAPGVYLMDGAALVLLSLALSGAWLWLAQRRKRAARRRAS